MIADVNGILLLNKPAGITSFKALGTIKKQLRLYTEQKVKVGHTGTLDSFAEGLLVVLTGKFTRFNSYFTMFDKEYEAEIEFGKETETLDPEGSVIKTGIIPDAEVVKEKSAGFLGPLKQRPPVFSAVHVNGERAYKKALRGEIEELPERDVIIHSFEILDWSPPHLRCMIKCSKGTYIRSIARDLGAACGSCAFLSGLKRLSVGPYNVSSSISAEQFNPAEDLLTGRKAFNELHGLYPEAFQALEINENYIEKIRKGMDIGDSFFKKAPGRNGSFTVFNIDEFIAYINYNSGNYSYNFVG